MKALDKNKLERDLEQLKVNANVDVAIQVLNILEDSLSFDCGKREEVRKAIDMIASLKTRENPSTMAGRIYFIDHQGEM